MTETVIAAPLELAQRLKSTFGSADNVNEPGEGSISVLLPFQKANEKGSL